MQSEECRGKREERDGRAARSMHHRLPPKETICHGQMLLKENAALWAANPPPMLRMDTPALAKGGYKTTGRAAAPAASVCPRTAVPHGSVGAARWAARQNHRSLTPTP